MDKRGKVARFLALLFMTLRLDRIPIPSMDRRGQGKGLGGILVTFLIMIVALALTPTVQEEVTGVTGVGANNLTGAALSIAALIPLFWVLLIIGVGVAAMYVQFKGFGGF